MPSASALLSRVRNSLTALYASANEKHLYQPLLQAEEILDLKRRAQMRTTEKRHINETAHRQHGDSPSPYRGYGLDYVESRPYAAGDEPRYMNWQLTARTGALYMKVFQEERQPGVFILMDRRTSMRFGTRSRLKVTQAARAATCLAFAAQQQHYTLSGVCLEDSPRWIEATGSNDVFPLIHAAAAPCPPVSTLQSGSQVPLSYVLNMMKSLLVPGSLIYLISDFMDLQETHRASLMQLATDHRVHAIHVYDPAEKELPISGILQFHTQDEDITTTMDTRSAQIRNEFAQVCAGYFSTRQALIESLGITYTQLSTQCDPIEKQLPLI